MRTLTSSTSFGTGLSLLRCLLLPNSFVTLPLAVLGLFRSLLLFSLALPLLVVVDVFVVGCVQEDLLELVLLWLLVLDMRMILPCGLFLVRFVVVVVDLISSVLMGTNEAEVISTKRDSEPEEANYYLWVVVAVAVAAVDYAGFVSN